MATLEALIPLPIGERVARPQGETGEGDSLHALGLRLTSPHPALRATFSPMGRRTEVETQYGNA